MAYQVPRQWAHGDIPTGALMQKYADALNAIKAQTDMSRWNAAGITGQTGTNDHIWTFVHVHRYLAYRGDGSIWDPDNPTENTVGLSGVGNWYATYDLQGVSWLYPGKMYMVEGVTGCLETWWG